MIEPKLGKRYIVIDGEGSDYYNTGDIVKFVDDDGTRCPWFINESWDHGHKISVHIHNIKPYNEGEEKMTNEEVSRPEYIIITRNTEVFKKGGVFRGYSSFFSPQNDAYVVEPYGESYVRPEQVDVLLQKKVAVEAVRFDPAFVTLEQNEVLGKALEGMKKKATAKKKPVGKPAVKKTVKKAN